MSHSTTLATCLWFDGDAEEAVGFYTSLIPGSSFDHRLASPVDWPGGKARETVLINFTMMGQPYQALNGGPGVEHTNAASLSVTCSDQAEVDRIWSAILENGGEEVMCGWIIDRFGLRWQVVPASFFNMMRTGSEEQVHAAFSAMNQMVKLDEAELKRAYDEAGS